MSLFMYYCVVTYVNVASLRKLRWRLDLRALRAFMKQAVGSSDLGATHHNTAR